MAEEEGIIDLKGCKIHQDKDLVLSDVDLRVDKGEFVYLIGKTGSGKSSLLKTFYGELPLREGEGKVVGFDLRKLKKRQIPYLRRNLGIVFQDFQLLSDRTVNDNLYFVMKATGWKDKQKIEERAQEVLDRVGLGTKGFKMPHELSGGEQQRVAIARALVNDPDLILADEPTGNLDPEISKGIMGLLFKISENGRAVVMATHDLMLLKEFPSRTLRIHDAKVGDASSAVL